MIATSTAMAQPWLQNSTRTRHLRLVSGRQRWLGKSKISLNHRNQQIGVVTHAKPFDSATGADFTGRIPPKHCIFLAHVFHDFSFCATSSAVHNTTNSVLTYDRHIMRPEKVVQGLRHKRLHVLPGLRPDKHQAPLEVGRKVSADMHAPSPAWGFRGLNLGYWRLPVLRWRGRRNLAPGRRIKLRLNGGYLGHVHSFRISQIQL
jgi:hypothetical protein